MEARNINDLSSILNSSQPVNEIYGKMNEQFSHSSQARGGNNQSLFPMQDDGDDPDEYEETGLQKYEQLQPSEFLAQSFFAKKIRQGVYSVDAPQQEETIESQLKEMGSEFDLNSILNSGRLMRLKLDMDKYPKSELCLEEFVVAMQEVVREHTNIDDEKLVSYLVDHFHRIDTHATGRVTFDMLSSYMIEQELVSESSKEKALLYRPSTISDQSRHDNYVDKLFYFSQIDLIGVMEQNMRTFKLYNAQSLRLEHIQLVKSGIALAAAYIPEFNVLVLTSSDKSMQILSTNTYSVQKLIITQESQHTMLWSHTHQILFSGGMKGKVYGWVMDEILNLEHKGREIPYQKVLAKGMPWCDGDHIIFEIVQLIKVNKLAVACDDKKIRIWKIQFKEEKKKSKHNEKDIDISRKWKEFDDRKKEKKNPQEFLGHTNAVRALAYSYTYNILISCGFQFDALVWNPYVSEPICHLKGHQSPLVSVQCPQVNPTIITADSKGFVIVWNITDYSQIQTFYALNQSIAASFVPNNNKLKVIKAIPKHRRLLAASRKLQVFDYERPFVPELSDDSPINCAVYSALQLQIFIAGQRAVKVWNARNGRPIKLIGNEMNREITALTLDETHRKVIVGDHSGKIIMADSLSGVVLKEFSSHSGEVTGLLYVAGDKMLISSGWDRKIIIHDDNLRMGMREKRGGICRSIVNAHCSDIICLEYSKSLDLVISAGRDCQVRVWDYETCALQAILLGHKAEILVLKCLEPYPLLLVSDQSGCLSLWAIDVQGYQKFQCLCKWRNMHTLEKTATITSATYWLQEGSILMALGDEKGTIRVLDLCGILQNIRPAERHRNQFRNPKRIAENVLLPTKIEEGMMRQPSSDSINSNFETGRHEIEFRGRPIKQDHIIRQVSQWKAHKESVKCLEYISEIQGSGILSAGLDNMARLWSINGVMLGVLKQGARVKQHWDFNLKEEVIRNKSEESKEIMTKMRQMPSRRAKDDEDVIQSLSHNKSDRPAATISTLEMIQKLNEVNEMFTDEPVQAKKDNRQHIRQKKKQSF